MTRRFSTSVANRPSQGRAGGVATAELREVVENRASNRSIGTTMLEDVLRLALLDGMLQLQRADAEQIAGGVDQRGAAPDRDGPAR